MVASHNQFLVVLSVVVSILGAYATIALIERLRDARGAVNISLKARLLGVRPSFSFMFASTSG